MTTAAVHILSVYAPVPRRQLLATLGLIPSGRPLYGFPLSSPYFSRHGTLLICVVLVDHVQLQGSSFVEEINSKFNATMTNVVRFRDTEESDLKEITSSTTIQVGMCMVL